jgi:chromosome segregation ATPase
MADTSAYVNAYIDNAVGMLHENINTILQMKTQAKMAVDTISARNEEVKNLQVQLDEIKLEYESSKSNLEKEFNSNRSNLQSKLDSTISELEKTKTVDNEEINKARADARKWEEECNVLKGKQGLVDTLTNQFNDVKKQLISKTKEFDDINNQYSSIKEELEQVKKLLTDSEKKLEEYENHNVKTPSKSAPKKNINTKNIVPPVVEPEEKDDDF